MGTIYIDDDHVNVTFGKMERSYPWGFDKARRSRPVKANEADMRFSTGDCYYVYPKKLHRYGTGKAPACRATIRGALAKLHRKCSGATDWETGEPLPCFGEEVAWGDHTVVVAGPVVGAAEFANSVVAIPGWPSPTVAALEAGADSLCSTPGDDIMTRAHSAMAGGTTTVNVHFRCFEMNYLTEVLHLYKVPKLFFDRNALPDPSSAPRQEL